MGDVSYSFRFGERGAGIKAEPEKECICKGQNGENDTEKRLNLRVKQLTVLSSARNREWWDP